MKISANLGFLFSDQPLPEAIRTARKIGFEAVECHWPYDVPPEQVMAALEETGIPMLGLNTLPGNVPAGEFGLAAVPGREVEARMAIEQAVAYAKAIGCRNVHVMGGRSEAPGCERTFIDALRYAADLVAGTGTGLLIEPLNTKDVPGYVLADLDHARRIIEAVGSPDLRIMFDCYHIQVMTGNVLKAYREVSPLVGHLQIASVPDRAEPDHGELDFRTILPAIYDLGYAGYVGAEYKPTSGSFAWLNGLRQF